MNLLSHISSTLKLGFILLCFSFFATISQAQTATVINDTDCDLKVLLHGLTSSCGTANETYVPVTSGTHVYTNAGNLNIAARIGATVKMANCSSQSATVYDNGPNAMCTYPTPVTSASFPAPAGCCYPVTLTFYVDLVVTGADCEVHIYHD